RPPLARAGLADRAIPAAREDRRAVDRLGPLPPARRHPQLAVRPDDRGHRPRVAPPDHGPPPHPRRPGAGRPSPRRSPGTPPDVGGHPLDIVKTHIAIALAVAAVEAGHTAYFITAAELLARLSRDQAARRLDQRWRFYPRPDLLVVDELGYGQFD